MKKSGLSDGIKITLIISATVILLAVFGMLFFSSLIPATNTVNANGQAVIEVMPDLVIINFNVETTADNASAAKDANEIIVSSLKDSLGEVEIVTVSYSVNPEYSWDRTGGRELIGYKAYHALKVELDANDSVGIGSVIDSGVDSGALISYINFELSKDLQNEYKALALKEAGEDAKIKAIATASGLDKKLGKLVSVTASDFSYYPWRTYGAVEDSVSASLAKEEVSITPGEQDVSASVTVRYEIK